ncbi:MAG: CDP-glycerol glycerophosphotransferase family protein [Erysipelotrichaceae bacterium]|nr:CDP-glycerol glycerophosphotransferase family protein [Erysipelotrichaceae bacterium]
MRIIKKIYHGFSFLLTMLLYVVSHPIAFIAYGKKKYWLISEVDFDARDNGIHFFKYLNKYHKDINSIYLISKQNANYDLVREIGEVVEPNSYKHMLIFIAAKAKISTLVHGCSPSYYVTMYLQKFHGTGKNIALKHGIFKNLHSNYFKKNAHLDLICCGAKPEYEFINDKFGYEKNVAQYTGLARFDELHDLNIKKEIFIMPTWRRWLDGISDVEEFKKSDYFLNWSNLLNDYNFLSLAKENNLQICFYVHPKLNKFLSCFNDIDKNIIFLNSKNGDSVQKHLKESAIMITDFSSVFFDYAYMKKPAIYYQFDEEEYYKSHYVKAYFDYRENGFGAVTTNSKDVINCLKDIVDNNLKINDVYLKRAEEFFPLNDKNNCQRIYEKIVEKL